jgi:hypothetical protein
MKAKRFGKFYVPHEVSDEGELCEILYKMRFVPYRVEFLAYKNQFEHIGTSRVFEDLEVGSETPTYKIMVDLDKGEIVSVQAVKV